MVPVLVWPQAFAADVQDEPYPEGFDGVVAEQLPLHWIVPVLVCPHAFADEVQDEPYPEGFAGADALQSCGLGQLTFVVPPLVVQYPDAEAPHAFVALHACV